MPRNRVQVPAVGMIVVAGLDIAFAAVLLVLNVVGVSMFRTAETMRGTWSHGVTEDLLMGGFGIMLCLVAILIDAVIILGAAGMRELRSYGLAVAAAILSVIPCLASPCFVLGMPFGIWALVVLMSEDVRNAFMEAERPHPSAAEGSK